MAAQGGTFVISWSQIELDGHHSAHPQQMRTGSQFIWRGDYVRLDGPTGLLPLGDPIGLAQDTARDERLRGQRLDQMTAKPAQLSLNDRLSETGFIVTDGLAEWPVQLIISDLARGPVCVFQDLPPMADTPLWVARVGAALRQPKAHRPPERDVVCFTPGTSILTANGNVAVENLREGDLVQTADNGLQPVMWIAMRAISDDDLRGAPELAPVLLRAGSLGSDVPDAPLLVSPDHRIVLRGARARTLYSADEVLAAARDLVDDHLVTVEYGRAGLSYIHLALPQHEVVFANGVATESFHPQSTGLASLEEDDRTRLLRQMPALSRGELSYGAYARRVLNQAEAAILRGDAGRVAAGA